MSQPLHINDYEVLRNFHDALKRFDEKTQGNIDSIQMEIQRTLEWIDERVQYWRSKIEYAENSMDDARHDLRRCESNSDDDGYADCRYEEDALQNAEYEFEECLRNLETAQQWRITLENAIEEYYKQTPRFRNLVTDHSDKAKAFLMSKYEKYSLVHSGGNYREINTNYSINDQNAQLISAENNQVKIVASVLSFNPTAIKNNADIIRQGMPKAIHGKLTDSEIIAINSLTFLEFININPVLRGKLKDKDLVKKYEEFAQVISSGLKKLPDYEGIVKRRVNYGDEDLAEHEADKVITYKSFTHCTYREKDVFPEKNTLLIIYAKHGKKVEFMSPESHEKEIIIDKGTNFLVLFKEKEPSGDNIIGLLEV